MISELKRSALVVTVSFLAACGARPAADTSIPSLSGLVSLEYEAGAGVVREFKGRKSLVNDFASPSFGEWVVIVVKDEADKQLPELAMYSCNNAAGAPPRVMTMDAYAEAINKEPAPAPGPVVLPGQKYPTLDERLAGMRQGLEKHPALVYRYCKKYPAAPAAR
ncbi:MAG TPA: hypothetical protein PKI19_13425 [Elusimicrobiales bacterium]|nr:hypothetical protein [Elusimicrobiales bacterium]